MINRENYNKNEVKDYFDDDDDAIEYAYGKYSLINKNQELSKVAHGLTDYFSYHLVLEDLKMKINQIVRLDLDVL